jgi:hypothetical protein
VFGECVYILIDHLVFVVFAKNFIESLDCVELYLIFGCFSLY